MPRKINKSIRNPSAFFRIPKFTIPNTTMTRPIVSHRPIRFSGIFSFSTSPSCIFFSSLYRKKSRRIISPIPDIPIRIRLAIKYVNPVIFAGCAPTPDLAMKILRMIHRITLPMQAPPISIPRIPATISAPSTS